MPETRKEPDPAAMDGRDMRGLSRCWQNNGWHVYMAGPCFDTYGQAISYRKELDREGVMWKPQRP